MTEELFSLFLLSKESGKSLTIVWQGDKDLSCIMRDGRLLLQANLAIRIWFHVFSVEDVMNDVQAHATLQ